MAFTRIKDDEVRVKKYIQETTDQGLYGLNTPGQGVSLSYMSGPQTRLTHWADNMADNAIDVENDLRGLSRFLNRDIVQQNDFKHNAVDFKHRSYSSSTETEVTDESRATNPTWWHREQQQYRSQILHYDPQENAITPFTNNVSSRFEQKRG